MERIVITIHPPSSDDELLTVADAMQQVIDLLTLHRAAEGTSESPDQTFDWRLERASTNTPFTVVAVAEAKDPAFDVTPQVQRAKSEVSSGLRRLIQSGDRPAWMDRDALNTARALFARNQNGIGVTEIDFGADERLSITRPDAESATRAIAGITAILEPQMKERHAWGEVQGVMVAVGRYWNRPAIQLRTEQYDFVWCRLPPEISQQFGSDHRITEVWEGKTIGVTGELFYAANGKLRIEATSIREIESAPLIDLDSVLDPDFTAGLEPDEYLRQLHDGTLAS